MQNLVTWFLDDVVTWLVVGIVASRITEGIKDSKVGQVIWSVVLGGASYYFVKNPQKVLEFMGNIIGKVFGG